MGKQKWKYEKGTQTVRTVPGNHCVVAIRNFSSGGSTDGTLNTEEVASLIAAAPELLFAVEAVMTGLMFPNTPGVPGVAELLKLCLAAANKARGEES